MTHCRSRPEVSPWLIVTFGWAPMTSAATGLAARLAAHPGVDALAAAGALALGCGVLVGLRARLGRRPAQ